MSAAGFFAGCLVVVMGAFYLADELCRWMHRRTDAHPTLNRKDGDL